MEKQAEVTYITFSVIINVNYLKFILFFLFLSCEEVSRLVSTMSEDETGNRALSGGHQKNVCFFFTITAESSRAHWLIFIVNKRTDT